MYFFMFVISALLHVPCHYLLPQIKARTPILSDQIKVAPLNSIRSCLWFEMIIAQMDRAPHPLLR